jgi:hypothetical protein
LLVQHDGSDDVPGDSLMAALEFVDQMVQALLAPVLLPKINAFSVPCKVLTTA